MKRKNNKDKFLELLMPVYWSLERYALTIANDYDGAKDIVSETVLDALEGFEKLRNKQAFLSYLFTIAKRKQIDYYHKNSRMNTIPQEIADSFPSSGRNPEDHTDAQFLREALTKLDEDSREALILFEFSGFKQKEIAEMQNTTIANVKVRIHRAKKRLGELLDVNETRPPAYGNQGAENE